MPSVNILRANFRNHTLPVRLQGVTVYQKFGKHGLTILDYQFREKRQYTMPKSETPVSVQWGKAPLGTRSFTGYVNHYDTRIDGSETVTEMYLLGTSKVLNTSNPTTWHGMTHSGIAREIAKRHNLRSVVTPSKRILPAWSTGTRSDFLSLNALSEETGFYSWVDGPTLYFLDPKKILRSAANMNPVRVTRQDIRSAQVTGGRDAPTDDSTPVRRRVLYGLDYRTNEFFQATGGDPSAPSAVINAPANDYNQARETTTAAGQRDEDYFSISVMMEGNANVFPGSLVFVAPGNLDTDQGGFWFVTEATHQISPEDFTTSWSGVRGTSSTPREARISTVSGASRQTTAVIRKSNIWEAEVQEHVHA